MKHNLALLGGIFHQFESLPFDEAVAETYGILRSRLSKIGQSIGPNDMMIAAIALANNAKLVTHNTRDFERIDELQLVDWEQ